MSIIDATLEGLSKAPDNGKARVALLTTSLSCGGERRTQAYLADAFASRGHHVDLLFLDSPGPSLYQAPASVNIVDLRAEGSLWRLVCLLARHPASVIVLLWYVLLRYRPFASPRSSVLGILREIMAFPVLVRHMSRSQPDVIYSAESRASLMAVWGRRLASPDTRVVISHQSLTSVHLSEQTERVGRWRARFALLLLRLTFLQADIIVSASDGAGDDLWQTMGVPRERITTIYNPTVPSEMPALMKAPLDHPWFHPGAPPVVLGAGRLVGQKDFPTLLRAFARVRRKRPARLVILGEGERRSELEALAAALEVTEDVDLPGFAANPFAYMSRAGVFALSSKWEGLGMVLVEALACGCPVVSTDCRAGPSEILQEGVGALVPVGDDAALAAAIEAVLDNPPPRERLVERGMEFTVERSVEQYAQFIPRGISLSP